MGNISGPENKDIQLERSLKDRWSIIETTDVKDFSGPASGTRRMMQKFAMAHEQKNYMLQLPSTIYEQMHAGSSQRLDSLKGVSKLKLKRQGNHRVTQSLVSSINGSPRNSGTYDTRYPDEDGTDDPLGSTYTNSLVRIAKSREQKLSERDVEKIKYMFLGTANTFSPVVPETGEKPLLQDRLTRKLAYRPHNLFGPRHQTSTELHSVSQELRQTKPSRVYPLASAEQSPNTSMIVPGRQMNKGRQILDPIISSFPTQPQESVFSTEAGVMTGANQSTVTPHNQSSLTRQVSRNYYGKKIDFRNELQFLLAGKNKAKQTAVGKTAAGARHPLAGGQSFDSVDGEAEKPQPKPEKVVLARQPSIPLSPTRRIVTSSNWVLHKSKYPYSVYANRLPRRLKIQVQDYNDFYAPAVRTGNRVWRVSVFVLLAIRRMNRLVQVRQEEIANIERLKKLAREKEEAERARLQELERKRLSELYQKQIELRRLDLASIAANEEPTVPLSNPGPRVPAEEGQNQDPQPPRLQSPADSHNLPQGALSGALSAAGRPSSPLTMQRKLSEQPKGWQPRTFAFPKVSGENELQGDRGAETGDRTPSISGVPIVGPGQAFVRVSEQRNTDIGGHSGEMRTAEKRRDGAAAQFVHGQGPNNEKPRNHHQGELGSGQKNTSTTTAGISGVNALGADGMEKKPLPKLAGLIGSSLMYYVEPGADSNEMKEWNKGPEDLKNEHFIHGADNDHTGQLLISSGLGIKRTWDILDIGHDARISQARDTTLADDKYNSPWLDIIDELLDATSLNAVYEVGYYSLFGIDDLKDLRQIDYDGEDDHEKNAVRAFWKLYAKVTIDCEMDEYLLDGLHFISDEYEQNFAFNSHAYYTPQDLNPKFFIKLYAPHFGIEMKNKVPEQLKKLANIARFKLNDKKPRLLPGEGTDASSNQELM